LSPTKVFKLVFLLFISTLSVQSQALVDVQFLQTYSANLLQIAFQQPVNNGVTLYMVQYETTGIDGQLDTASGLLVVPEIEQATGWVIYQHGTTNGPADVPSNAEADAVAAVAYGSMSFVSISTDYLGLGDSRGFHPYVHAETEVQAAMDLYVAAQSFIEDLELPVEERLFISGYSQGGHASMALHQSLEEVDMEITAATHMSGPYDLSGTMKEFVLSDSTYNFISYVVYMILGYQEVYQDIYDSLEQVFLPEFIPVIDSFYKREISLTNLNLSLISKLMADGKKSNGRNLLTDEFIVKAEDSLSIISQHLMENDVYRWIPLAPTRLYYCTSDDQVSYINAIVASEYMIENGAADLAAVNLSDNLDHGDCAIPAFMNSVDFFNSFITISGHHEISGKDVYIYPNPTSDWITIESQTGVVQSEVYGIDGKLLQKNDLNRINLYSFQPGLYILKVYTTQGVVSKKILKQ